MRPDDQPLKELATAVLDRRTQSLSPQIQARLRSVRREAVAAMGEGHRSDWLRWALPAGGLIAATLVAVLATGLVTKTAPISGIEDVNILAAKQSPNFYQDEPGFYLWLDGQQRAG